MPKFDLGAAWEDGVVLFKSHNTLTFTIAAFFFFLPALAVSWFGPAPITPPTGASFDQIMASFRENAVQGLAYDVLTGLLSSIGGIAILRLWLARSGTSVGEALIFGARMLPTMIVVQLLIGVGFALSGLLLVVPGFLLGGVIGGILALFGLLGFLVLCAYLAGRLAVISPALADQAIYNPLTALDTGWRVTENNGWRIFLYLLLVGLVVLVVALIFFAIGAVLSSAGEGAAKIVDGLIIGGITTIANIVMLAVSASIYRQLVTRGGKDIFS